MTKEEFVNKVMEYKEIYPQEMLEAFIKYWEDKWEKQKTFNIKARLSKWNRNNTVVYPKKQLVNNFRRLLEKRNNPLDL